MGAEDRERSPAPKADRAIQTRRAIVVIGTILLAGASVWLLRDPEDLRSLKAWAVLFTMGAIFAGWAADRLKLHTWSQVTTGLLVVVAVVSFAIGSGSGAHKLIVKERINSWNAFHYVLGTKFFGEVGYHDFYNAAALADADADNVFSRFDTVRDLESYEHIPVAEAIERAEEAGVRERFSDERWEEFKGDQLKLQEYRGKKRWSGPLNDLGFHPSPAWLVVHQPLLNVVDIQRGKTLEILCGSDLLLILLTIAALWWGFGLRTAAISTIWLHIYFGNDGLLVGGYFHYDWLFWTVLAAALYRKGYTAAAGAVLAYPAMMRGYPGLLALGPGIVLARDLLTKRAVARRQLAFVVALALSCGLFFGLGSATRHGPTAWMEWKEKISQHASIHPTGRQRLGLKFVCAHDFEKYGKKLAKRHRGPTLEKNHGTVVKLQIGLGLLFLLAMLRRRDENGMILSLGLILIAMVLSRYYFSIWLLMFCMVPTDRFKIGNLLISLGFMGLLLSYYFTDTTVIHQYHVYNVWVLSFFALLAAVYLIKDGVELLVKYRAR